MDRYFPATPGMLEHYASVFTAVEGNTTFYRVPDADTVARWRDAVTGSRFRFSFKLPREVTHERRPETRTLERFLDVIGGLREHVGPLLVQFPARVGPDELEHFAPVLDAVSERYRCVVEVRHPAFFDEPARLEPLLERASAGRVMLDSRPLYEGDRDHPDVVKALHEKPDVPVIPAVYNGVAFIRLILHPDIVSNRRYIDEWAERVARWLSGDVEVIVMIHCPENLHCPPLARDFHDALARRFADIDALPAYPVPQQQDLLG
jgi:uncharacterized protein YecE (DUF72 family)